MKITAPAFCLLLAFALTLFAAAPAWSCPVCDSPTAVEVRSGLAEDLNAKTLAAVAMPFVVVAGVVAMIHFGVPNFKRKP